MENNEIYPKGTVNQTEEFALRQKIKKIVGENVEEIIKEQTIEAFKGLGYEEKDSYMFVVASGGKDNKEKEVGKGTKEGKLNVTVSIPKMLNMGATKPVSYMQKVSTFGGKKIVSEIYLEIIDKTVHVDYKNTEAAAFHQSSSKDTYAPGQLSKSGIITGLENEASFKKDFKKFFEPIAEAEAMYLVGTKIGNDDKSEKNMNDSIIKENKYSMKLTDLFSSSFEDAGNQINKLVKESFEDSIEPFKVHGHYTVSNSGGYEIMLSDSGDAAKVRDAYGSDNPKTSDWLEIEYVPSEDGEDSEPVIDPNGYNIPLNQVMRANLRESDENNSHGTPKTSTGEPTDKKLVIGSEDKLEDNKEEELDEMTTAGAGAGSAGQVGYLTPHAFTSDGKTKAFKANKDYTQVQMNEDVKKTTYGMMRTQRAHLTRQNDGSYKVISENSSFPFTEKVDMESGYLNVPKDMTKNYTMGRPGEPNSKEELANTGHGDLDKIQKQGTMENKKENLDEGYKRTINLTKRKFSSLSENEEKGINKRYIISEKVSKEDQSRRWKELFENDCFCNVKDRQDTVSADSYEQMANKEFEANNPPLESDLCDTQFSGEKQGFMDVPKARGSMIMFRLSESDVRKNKMYIIDHFTQKLVFSPLYKSKD